MGGAIRVFGAIALIAGAAQMAHADTFYELGRVDGDVFALDANIGETAEGHKAVTYYRAPASHLVEQFTVEVDCAGKRVRTMARKFVRPDLSAVREASSPGDWQKPDRKTIGGILLNAACALPAAPRGLKRTDAASPADYLRETAGEVLARRSPSRPAIIFDYTTVGDCIFAQMPQKVRDEAILSLTPTQVEGFNEQVNALGAKCSGRPESKGDSLVIGAALSIFQRWSVMTRLGGDRKIAEDHLAAAWNTASAETRKPLLERAAMLHDPGKTVRDVQNADPAPIRSSVDVLLNSPVLKPRLDALALNEQQKRGLLSLYFNAVAMGEVAEAQLRRAS